MWSFLFPHLEKQNVYGFGGLQSHVTWDLAHYCSSYSPYNLWCGELAVQCAVISNEILDLYCYHLKGNGIRIFFRWCPALLSLPFMWMGCVFLQCWCIWWGKQSLLKNCRGPGPFVSAANEWRLLLIMQLKEGVQKMTPKYFDVVLNLKN